MKNKKEMQQNLASRKLAKQYLVKRLGFHPNWAKSLGLSLKLAACAGVLAVTACSSSKNVGFESSSSTLAAEPEVHTKQTSNGNSEVTLKIKHLTPPEKVKPNSTTYVVWAKPVNPANAPLMNLGGLKPDKNLNAEFKTVTPYRDFKLMLTPETDQAALMPTSDPVLVSDEIGAR